MAIEIARRGIDSRFESGSRAYARQVKGLMFGEHETVEISEGCGVDIGENGYLTLRTPDGVATIQVGQVIPDKRPRLRPFMSPTNAMLMCELVWPGQERTPFQFRFCSDLSLKENLTLLAEHVNILSSLRP